MNIKKNIRKKYYNLFTLVYYPNEGYLVVIVTPVILDAAGDVWDLWETCGDCRAWGWGVGEPNGGAYEVDEVEDFSKRVGGRGRECIKERKARGCHVEGKSVGKRASVLKKRWESRRVRKGRQGCSGGKEKQQKLVQEQQCLGGERREREKERDKNRRERVAEHEGKDVEGNIRTFFFLPFQKWNDFGRSTKRFWREKKIYRTPELRL